ncbi:MAG: helix-turn-helix domain-containing protein [Candidatus Dehalobacter alkaniphilus]
MKATEAVKKIMEDSNITNAKLASRIGCSNAVIYERLTQKNISVNSLDQMLAALDYEIVLQPKSSGRRPEGCFVVDGGMKK